MTPFALASTTSRHRLWMMCTALVAAAPLLLAAVDCRADSQATDELKVIFRHWSTRQYAVRTARFTWRQTLTARKPSSQLSAGGSAPSEGPAMATVSQEVTYLIDNHWTSYTVRTTERTEDAKQLSMPPVYKSTSNGKESRMYAAIESNDPARGTGVGVIKAKAAAFDVDAPTLRCLILAFRGMNPMFADLMHKKYRIFSREESIDDIPCLVIEDASDTQPHKFLWLDPARNFLVLRETETHDGVERIRRDYTYQQDASHGWVPSAWKIVTFDANRDLVESIDASVTSYSINTPIPVEEFILSFPAGTAVTGATNDAGKNQVAGGNSSLKAIERFLSSRTSILIIGNVAAAAVFMGVRACRRRYFPPDS